MNVWNENHVNIVMNYPQQAAGYRLLSWPVIPYVTRLPRTGYGGIQSGPLDTGFRRYDELAASRGG